MKNLGWMVESDIFNDTTPNFNTLEFENIVAKLNPDASRYLVLACHYDSKYSREGDFVGATDSAVPCAQLVNLATVMKEQLNSAKTVGTFDSGWSISIEKCQKAFKIKQIFFISIQICLNYLEIFNYVYLHVCLKGEMKFVLYIPYLCTQLLFTPFLTSNEKFMVYTQNVPPLFLPEKKA